MTTQKDIERAIRWVGKISTALETSVSGILTVADHLHAQAYFLADKVDVFVTALNEEIHKEEAKLQPQSQVAPEPEQTGAEQDAPVESPELDNLEKVHFVRQFLSKCGHTNNIWFTDQWKTELHQETLDELYGYVKRVTEQLGRAGHPLFNDE